MIKNLQRWFWVSVVTIVVSIGIIFGVGLQWGADFTGGSLLEIQSHSLGTDQVTQIAQDSLDVVVTVQPSEEMRFLVRSEPLSEEQHQQVMTSLRDADETVVELRFESIGPTIGEELRRKAIWAVSLVIIAMIGYLAYAFRTASGLVSSWKFGVAATYALVHDVLVVTALFALFGQWWDVRIDTLFVTAMLALLGYSVNDTIVLFDRLREEWNRGSGSLAEMIDRAVKATLVRSLNTSLTTIVVLLALLGFGGLSIRWFVVALLLGTIVGTYSSIFVASPMLWELAKK